MILEDKADLPVTKAGQIRLGKCGRILAVEQNAAVARRLEGANDAQQRAFARSTGAENCQVLSSLQFERNVSEHHERLTAGGILFGNVFDAESSHDSRADNGSQSGIVEAATSRFLAEYETHGHHPIMWRDATSTTL